MKAPYKCLYNHELLILATSQTPYASYQEPVTDRQTIGLVEELKGTGVDALMICPQAWMTNLWVSAIDRRWQDVAPLEKEPLFEANTKYFEKAYFRIRRYIMEGKDPVALTIKTARACGIAPFFSYRMNEEHYTNNPAGSTHGKFWKEHPHFMLDPTGSNLNYLEAEVRDYYFSLFSELIEKYDVDGFECDFMRHPRYFPPDKMKEGRAVMTEFVGKLRARLDEVGKKRGRRLSLSVRVPLSVENALETGLDVVAWDEKGYVDMVNVSSMFRLTQEVGMEGYRARIKNASIYGELNFISQSGDGPGKYWININRLAEPELFKSTALSFLERGADGISLFNFAYSRDHSFNEPRRSYYPGVEPRFEVLPALVSREKLRNSSQLVTLTPEFGSLPLSIRGRQSHAFRLYVGDVFHRPFVGALLRIEADSYLFHRPFRAEINGQSTRPVIYAGSLFPPPSIEALAPPEQVLHFSFDPKALRPGYNEVRIFNEWVTSGGGKYRGGLRLVRLEIALYRTASDEFKERVLI